MKLRNLALGGMVAALYAALTVLLAPLSYGPVQLRFSEGLTLLPYFLPEAVPGLAAGCLIANLFGGYGAVDVIVGTGATLLAALLTRRMPRLWMAALPPVLVNMLLIGGMLHVLVGTPLAATCLYVGLGEAGACFLIGLPLMRSLERRGILRRDAGGSVR
nr:QueT transporter family protein [uncultured Fretibacterium sp.]